MAYRTSKRPLGHLTRGKTAYNRLRRVDNFVMLYDPALLRRVDGLFTDACFVDVGYGAEPTTTLESASRFRRVNARLPVLGVEIDRERVETARPFSDNLTDFREGGFNLPLKPGETVRLIRAFNVLRQYDESAVSESLAELGAFLLPGGLLIEGTSDPFGRVWVANVLRKPETESAEPSMFTQQTGLVSEGLVFSFNLRFAFDPTAFQPVLPKNFIHRVIPGEPVYDFFSAWKSAYQMALPLQVWGPRQVFVSATLRLKQLGYRVDVRRGFLKRGYLRWVWDG